MDFHKILSTLTALEGAPSGKKTIKESIEIRADGPEAMTLLGHPEASTASAPPEDDFGLGNDGIGGTDLGDIASAAVGADPATDVAVDVVGDEGGDETSIGDLQRLSGLEPSMEEEADPVYANSPDEDIKPLAAAIPSGDDLHKQKRGYASSALGDNPRSVNALEAKLTKSLRDYLSEAEDKEEKTYGKDKNKVGKPAKGVDDNKLRATKG